MQEKQGEARCPYVSCPARPVSSSLGGPGMRLGGAWDFISNHDAASAGAGAAGVGVLVVYSPGARRLRIALLWRRPERAWCGQPS